MRKFKLSVVVLFFLFGCNGKRVIDNVYQAPGCQPYTIASDLNYVGSPALKERHGCSGIDCPMYGSSNGKAVADLFAGSEKGKLKEVVVLLRSQTASGYYWPALGGDKVEFGGKEYAEAFFAVNGENEDAYLAMLVDAGYELDGEPLEVRALARNLNRTTRLYLFYGLSEAFLSDEAEDEKTAEKDYLRRKFEERILVPGNI